MIDNQTISQPYSDNPTIWIYRSGYDERGHKGLDRYGKTDEFYRRTGQGEFIQMGMILVLDKKMRMIDDLYNFFGFERGPMNGGKRTSGYHLKVCFDHYGRLLMFKRDLDYEPEQFIKKTRTRTSLWRLWTPENYQNHFFQQERKKDVSEYTTWGWTFRRPEDYLVFQVTPWKMNTLIPEHNLNSLTFDEEFCEKLWNTGITDLSKSWVTPESEAEVERLWKMREQRQ